MRRKILIFQESWGCGGIETFVMGLLRDLSLDEFDVELFSVYDWDSCYDDELHTLGIRRTTVFPGRMPGHLRRFFAGTSAWHKRLGEGGVDVVHVNAMNGLTLVYVAIAKKRGVPVRIAHSHNTSFAGGSRRVKAAVHLAARMFWGGAATRRLACSCAAGSYLFGKKGYTCVTNGIDTQRFKYDSATRERTRLALGISSSDYVVGSIGRLSYQKNPLFTLNVFAELVRRDKNARLLLVGNGELEDEVMSEVTALKLKDRFIHLPSVTKPEDYYCAFDAFILPSRFEGFGYVLLEAQSSGLACITSDAVQDEVCVTELVSRITLDSGPAAWCDLLLETRDKPVDRSSYADKVAGAGYSLNASSEAVRNAWR